MKHLKGVTLHAICDAPWHRPREDGELLKFVPANPTARSAEPEHPKLNSKQRRQMRRQAEMPWLAWR